MILGANRSRLQKKITEKNEVEAAMGVVGLHHHQQQSRRNVGVEKVGLLSNYIENSGLSSKFKKRSFSPTMAALLVL